MASGQFRVQELNPFMEWHLHTTATSLEVASEEAKRIARMIGRRTRVLNEDGTVLTEVNP
jgi:succinyl-CoA synthetase beta subunit